MCVAGVLSGCPHSEHDDRAGPLLPAGCRREPPQPSEAHRGRDQDRCCQPGTAAGDWRVSGSQEARRSVCPGRSGEFFARAQVKYPLAAFFYTHKNSTVGHFATLY